MSQAAPATTAERSARTYGLFIDNQPVDPADLADPADGDYLDVVNPATGIVWARVPNAPAAAVDAAVRSARDAFEGGDWPAFRAADRAAFLIRFGTVIADHAEELAGLQV